MFEKIKNTLAVLAFICVVAIYFFKFVGSNETVQPNNSSAAAVTDSDSSREDTSKVSHNLQSGQTEQSTKYTASALVEDNGFLEVPSIQKGTKESPVIASLAEEIDAMRQLIASDKIAVEVPKALAENKEGVDFVLACEENTSEFIGRYFYIFMKPEKKFMLPQHSVNDMNNYKHGIVGKGLDTVLRFYYRNIYTDQSPLGLHFRSLDVSQSKYNLYSPSAFPQANDHSNEKVTIDRKTGNSIVKTKRKFAGQPEPMSFIDRYPCKKLTVEAGEVVTDFYTGRALLSALEEWEDLEGEFSESRDTENKL